MGRGWDRCSLASKHTSIEGRVSIALGVALEIQHGIPEEWIASSQQLVQFEGPLGAGDHAPIPGVQQGLGPPGPITPHQDPLQPFKLSFSVISIHLH